MHTPVTVGKFLCGQSIVIERERVSVDGVPEGGMEDYRHFMLLKSQNSGEMCLARDSCKQENVFMPAF